ncbi:galactose-1-phosphate uridylyltransferase [Methanospirillum sp.]
MKIEMFQSRRLEHANGFIEFRTESLTGLKTRICPERLKRGIGIPDIPEYSSEGCPFCSDLVTSVTPVFPDGSRLIIGESITFPNLYPFASYHTVTVISRDHMVRTFTHRQIHDALTAQIESLEEQSGYVSINWNFLPSAGASLPHPHLQGLADPVPDTLPMKYLHGSEEFFHRHDYSWWKVLCDHESDSDRFLNGLNLFWYAHPVPIGEKEIRCVLPGTTLTDFGCVVRDFAEDLVRILDFYQDMGNGAWNLSIFFGKESERRYFNSFATIVARINPNPLSTSDTAFMEKLHMEPVILTLPEDIGMLWRTNNKS